MGFNPRDFMSVQDAVKQSQTAQAAPQPQAGGYIPQYVGKEAYSTTVMPETGAPGPNKSMEGSRTHATLGTANDMAKLYGTRVLQANMAQGPTRTNAAQYALDFGVPGSDPLNAGLLAERFDTSNPNRDKFWDSPYWRDKAVQDELLYAQRYNPTAAKRDQSSFEGPVNNPQYQWSTPQGGANYLNGGQSPMGKAKLSVSQGAGIGLPGARPQTTAQTTAPRTQQSLYGAPQRRTASPMSMGANAYGARQPQRQPAQQPVISAYKPVGMGRAF